MRNTARQAYCRACLSYQKQIIRLRASVKELERMADKIIDEKYALVKRIERD